MNILIFGATGMVGRGVLRECLLDPKVNRVVTVGRRTSGVSDPKLQEIIHQNFLDFFTIQKDLSGFDACFFCLGVSAAGMKEALYTRITYDYTVAAAQLLVRLNPTMTFIYISGMGTNENGRFMWARVKGRTESALFKLPFKAVYMFRPSGIIPLDGIVSNTKTYHLIYAILKPFAPLVKALLPNYVTTTRQLGRAMIGVAFSGYSKRVLNTNDIESFEPKV